MHRLKEGHHNLQRYRMTTAKKKYILLWDPKAKIHITDIRRYKSIDKDKAGETDYTTIILNTRLKSKWYIKTAESTHVLVKNIERRIINTNEKRAKFDIKSPKMIRLVGKWTIWLVTPSSAHPSPYLHTIPPPMVKSRIEIYKRVLTQKYSNTLLLTFNYHIRSSFSKM